ncbi:MAG: nucleotide exchange factor GrpE [Nitrospirota bacterium]
MKRHDDKHREGHHEGHKVPIQEGYRVEEEGREEAMGPAGIPDEAKLADDPEAVLKDMEKLRAELDKAKHEAHEYKDRYLRLYAETENFKKRMSRDVIEQGKYANENLIKEIIPVLDNLERAISHSDSTPGAQGGEALVEGVKMVAKQLMDVLTKFGVTQVESVGKPFDPNRQQAMMHVETADYEPGTVVEEFQKGYFLNDRILRPAMVTVAKPPSKDVSE